MLALAALVTAACAPYALVKPERETLGGVLSVQPGVEWNLVKAPVWDGRIEVWTQDGQTLDTLVFFLGVKDGEPLFGSRSGAGSDSPPRAQPGARGESLLRTLSEEGEALFRSRSGADGAAPVDRPPPFRATMTGIEIAELFAATLVRNLASPLVAIDRVAPATLGSLPGFAFDIRFAGRDGVEHEGSAVGAVHAGRLYLLWYEGAKLHYYARYQAEFARIVASVRLVGR